MLSVPDREMGCPPPAGIGGNAAVAQDNHFMVLTDGLGAASWFARFAAIAMP